MNLAEKKQRIDFLDYMRVFAFVSVLVGHKFDEPLEKLASGAGAFLPRLAAEALLPFCRGGLVGVVVFFLTSGYIITHVIRHETAGEFAVKRIFRIYPLYIFAVVAEILAAGVWPAPDVLLPRLLLLGDFFRTPYALSGVEWTLRIEILFYAFMAALKVTGALDRPRILPLVFAATTAAWYLTKPVPDYAGWSDGYTSLYFPFLLIGSLIYLAERRLAPLGQCVVLPITIFAAYVFLMRTLHPSWLHPYYPAYGIAVFMCAWSVRDRLRSAATLRWLSNLTFAVYLFHNWLWSYLDVLASRAGATGPAQEIAVLGILLFVCHASVVTVERHGIALGSALARRIRGFHVRRAEQRMACAATRDS